MNNFEKWKAELTLEDFAVEKSQSGSCDVCPLFGALRGCSATSYSCYTALKEWGEQDAR